MNLKGKFWENSSIRQEAEQQKQREADEERLRISAEEENKLYVKFQEISN